MAAVKAQKRVPFSDEEEEALSKLYPAIHKKGDMVNIVFLEKNIAKLYFMVGFQR